MASQSNSGSVSFTHPLSIKLDDTNFLIWSQQVEAVIIAHKLHRFVVNPDIPLKYSSEVDRAQDKVSDAYEKWLVQDQMLFTWLLSSLSDSFLPRVLGCKHSWEAWDKIQKHFHSTMKAKVRQLRSELKSTKKGTRSVNEYVLRIKSIFDALVATGDSISEQDQIDAILEGLPEEYGPFIMMIYSRSDSPSVTDIESLLMVQEAQLEKFKPDLTAGSNSVSVNVAHTGNFAKSNSAENSESDKGGR